MAIVQTVRAQLNNSSSVSATIAATSAGNTIVVCVAAYQNLPAASQITDNKSGGSSTYVLATGTAVSGGGSGDSKTGIVYVSNCAAGITSVTYTVGAGSYGTIVVFELSSMLSSSYDKSTGAGGNSTAVASGSTGTLTQANEVAIGVMADDYPGGAAETITPTSPWVQVFEDETANITANSETRQIVTATTALNAQWTLSATRGWAASIATFMESGGAAPKAPPHRRRRQMYQRGLIVR